MIRNKYMIDKTYQGMQRNCTVCGKRLFLHFGKYNQITATCCNDKCEQYLKEKNIN